MIATAALAAQYVGTLELLDNTRVDAVAAQPPPQVPSPQREIVIGTNATTTPTVRLRLQGRRWDWFLSYSPTIGLTDMELLSESQPVFMNTGVVGFGWRHRLVTLRVMETASYGFQNLLYAYTAPLQGGGVVGPPITAPAMPIGGMPAQPTMPAQAGQPAATSPLNQYTYGSSVTTAALWWRPVRRFSTVLTGGYSVTGNLDGSNTTAANVLPLQYGPFGTLIADYGVSKTDSLVTRLSGQDTTTPMGVCVPPSVRTCRLETPAVTLQELFRRRLSVTGTLSFGAGASAGVYYTNTGSEWVVLPAAEVRYVQRVEGVGGSLSPLDTSTVTLLAQLAPTVDINTGQANNMVQASAIAVRRVAPNVFLTVVANVFKSVPPDPAPITGVSASTSARWRVDRQIELVAGIQGFWQYQSAFATIPTTTTAEVAFLSMIARVPVMHF